MGLTTVWRRKGKRWVSKSEGSMSFALKEIFIHWQTNKKSSCLPDNGSFPDSIYNYRHPSGLGLQSALTLESGPLECQKYKLYCMIRQL